MTEKVLIEVEMRSEEYRQSQVIYSGIADYKQRDQIQILSYTDKDNIDNRVRFSASSCLISRKGEQSTKLILKEKGDSYIEVQSELGTFRFEALTLQYLNQPDFWSVRYEIGDDNEFACTWKITEKLS